MNRQSLLKWGLIILSFLIIILILWNTNTFFQHFKSEERLKMEIWSEAQKEITNTTNLNDNISGLLLEIIQSNKSTPMIKVDIDNNIETNNIPEERAKDTVYIRKLIEQYKSENTPIEIKYHNKVYATLYFGNSKLLNKLKYYPVTLLLIIILFGFVVYLFYKSSKIAEQNQLWTGMAKETAHQIGTPLSSLVGWNELLKTEHPENDYFNEIDKDIKRLNIITQRFSKIGSIPTLVTKDFVEESLNSINYLIARTSKNIEFNLDIPDFKIPVKLDPTLYSWTIENLIKNGIDAMKGKGKISIRISKVKNKAVIHITDTGKGIPKSDFEKVFNPGFTTKKRGWGLGLSLTKRIIEEYHNGKIKIIESQINKGSTMQITLNRL